MRYLHNKFFEDLMDRFKWYSKPFTINIFCKDKESMTIFEKEIDNRNLNFQKHKGVKNIRYRDEYKVIDIYLISDRGIFGRSGRANATIFDGSFPFDVVAEIFEPLTNIEPSYGCFWFQKGTLEKDLKGTHALQDYEIDLED